MHRGTIKTRSTTASSIAKPTPKKVVSTKVSKAKPKCSKYVSLISLSKWFSKDVYDDDDLDKVTSIIDGFTIHLDTCDCSTQSATKLAIASGYMQKFSILLKNSTSALESLQNDLSFKKNKSEKDENQKDESEDESEKDQSKKDGSNNVNSYLNDFSIKKSASKFNSNLIKDANFENFFVLINPAIKALNYFKESFDDDKTEKYLTETVVTKIRVLEHLNSLFQIFIFYDLESYALNSVNLAIAFIETYFSMEIRDDLRNEDIQVTYCNMVRILLHLGCFENARLFFKQRFSKFTFDDVNTISSYGESMIFLLACEIALRSRKGKLYSDKLKDFLNCQYVSKSSIKRYGAKIMALLLASKFPSATYQFSANFSEFIEPFQSATNVCKRWKLFSSDTDMPDPIWYRFTIFNLMFESNEVLLNFYSSAGILHDASYYFKMVCSFYMSTLNIIGLAKLYLLCTEFDARNGFLEDAKCKIDTFEQLFTSKCNHANQTLFENQSKKSINIKTSLHIDKPETLDQYDFFAIEESKSLSTNIFEVYQKLTQLNRPKVVDLGDDNGLSNMENITKIFQKKFNQLEPNRRIFKSSFYLYMKMATLNLMIHHEETKDTYQNITNQCGQLLGAFENYVVNYVSILSDIVNINLKSSIEEQIAHGYGSNLFWLIVSFCVQTLTENKRYEEALCYLHKIVDFSTYTFENRIYRCEMFYYNAFVIYKLIKNLNQENAKKITKFSYDDLFVQSLEEESNVNNPKTPTRARRTNAAPNAPKANNFVSNTVHKYASNLFEVATSAKENAEGSRKNLALNFDLPPPLPLKNIGKKVLRSRNALSNRLDIYKDSTTDQLSSKLNTMLKLSDTHEMYLANIFDTDKFKQKLDLSKYSLDDIKILLNKIACYIGLHPSWVLYQKCHYLHYKFSKLIGKNSLYQVYHLAESAHYASFRYRSIFISFRKSLTLKKKVPGIDYVQFKCEDFSILPYLKELPEKWRFVQFKLIDNGSQFPDLLICRFQMGTKPVIFKIKCNKQQKILKHFLDEFNEIMIGNSTSIVEVNRDIYWKLRFDLDKRLKMLLESFESSYLGPFKAILLGNVENLDYNKICSWFKKRLISSAKTHNLECSDLPLLDTFVESLIFLSENEFKVGMKILFNADNSKLNSELIDLKKRYFKDYSTPEQINSLYNGAIPVGLILDSKLCQFPFESLPTYRQVHQPFFRVPSLRVASLLYNAFEKSYLATGVSDKNTYYLLNPSNNLKNTEEFFRKKLEICNYWQGVIGQEPTPEELKAQLEKCDLYIYIGHGSGCIYYRKISKGGLDGMCLKPVSIVFGCSSGRVFSEGKIEETFGVPYRFLINGSPCYLGNLWDVTDKDIDNLTDRFFSHWLTSWDVDFKKETSLPKSLAMSREVCKLKYLIGCAPVVYGLPLHRSIL